MCLLSLTVSESLDIPSNRINSCFRSTHQHHPTKINSSGSIGSSECETACFDIDNLSTDELASTSDSIPDLEDHRGRIVRGPWRTHIRRVRPTRLRLRITPTQVWRDRFRPMRPEHEGQPWREVLGIMVDEQQSMTFEGPG